MKRVAQFIIQILTLALFVVLIVIGKMQLWMVLFVASVILALFFGRFFCGWICPINTLMRGVTWVKRKLHIKSVKIPRFLKKPWVRYTLLGAFIIAFIFTMITGKKLPVLPILLGAGVLFTLIFPEELWHRYLCPYGSILSLPSRKSKHAMHIDAEMCNNCGACQRTCPAAAVRKDDNHHTIIKHNCLVCMACERKCPQNAIRYQ